MRTSDLNKLITIQHPTQVGDGMGGFTVTWTDYATNVWAAIWPTSAATVIRAMAPSMEISHRIRIRFRRKFISDWRIKFGHRYFDIVSVINPSEANEWLDIMAKEVA